jgi:SAM-dependent methyltransferase
MELSMTDDQPNAATAIAANRAAWDASAPLHRRSAAWARLTEGFRCPGFTCFDGKANILRAALEAEGVAGRDAAQVCCNNGRETLSLKAMGARRVVGFDQSEAFLEQARELAAIAGLDCAFVQADANALPPVYRESFDIVLLTIGVFGWMPDLPLFMANACGLLRPGGLLLVQEEHPVANMFEVRSARPMEAVHSYFKPRPFVSRSAIVYEGEEAPPIGPHYWFVHPLGRIFSAIIGNGLAILSFEEFGDNISSAEFEVLVSAEPILPLSYLLKARKAL